jgi:hypothetical protein
MGAPLSSIIVFPQREINSITGFFIEIFQNPFTINNIKPPKKQYYLFHDHPIMTNPLLSLSLHGLLPSGKREGRRGILLIFIDQGKIWPKEVENR